MVEHLAALKRGMPSKIEDPVFKDCPLTLLLLLLLTIFFFSFFGWGRGLLILQRNGPAFRKSDLLPRRSLIRSFVHTDVSPAVLIYNLTTQRDVQVVSAMDTQPSAQQLQDTNPVTLSPTSDKVGGQIKPS